MNPPKHTHERLDVERWWALGMKWTPVTERLPDDEESVLIWCDGEPWTGYVDGKHWHYICGEPMGAHVTHWMHFPDGPETEVEAA